MIKSDGEGDEFEFAFAAREDWTASISSIGGNKSCGYDCGPALRVRSPGTGRVRIRSQY